MKIINKMWRIEKCQWRISNAWRSWRRNGSAAAKNTYLNVANKWRWLALGCNGGPGVAEMSYLAAGIWRVNVGVKAVSQLNGVM
jgi:hypothetical protein